MPKTSHLLLAMFAFALLFSLGFQRPARTDNDDRQPPGLAGFGVVGDGKADDAEALQRAVDAKLGSIRLPAGTYRFTKTVTIDLDRVGPTSISGDGTARVVMAGPGPAFRFIGTHEGTASPKTVKANVWERQRTPTVDGVEIVGEHPEACGIEATGTMQLTVSRVAVRNALHGIHLVKRNRNVILSECHLYDNRGVGVFLDRLNLHQINIANCHISYNDGGGVVVKQSEIRNLHIGTCDIEGNMGGPDSEPTANVLLDSTGSSVAEVAIVGCTIQHTHEAPGSANIRFNGKSTKRPFTDELRHGHVTIADNVLSDVQVNIELDGVRSAAITGNTMWKAYSRNIILRRCANVAVTGNMLDRNPRYHYGDGDTAKLGVLIEDCEDGTVQGNHVHGTGDVEAALVLRRCRRFNLDGNTILDFQNAGLILDDVSHCRLSDSLIRSDLPGSENNWSLRVMGGEDNSFYDNTLGNRH